MSFIGPLTARKVFQPEKLGQTPFFNHGRIDTLIPLLGVIDPDNDRIDTADQRIDNEWNWRVAGTESVYIPTPMNPFSIPDGYVDPEGNLTALEFVNNDFCAAVDLAIKWKILDDQEALESVIRILAAWSQVTVIDTNAGSYLNWLDKWPIMIQAAMMVRESELYSASLDTAMIAATNLGLAQSVAYSTTNNLAAWSVCYQIAAATFTNNKGLLKSSIRRWQSLFDQAVVGNVPIYEVYREGGGYGNGSSGLWYSNFFVSAMVIAAEWARFSGAWLYDYQALNNSTLQQLVYNVRSWTRYPETFSYNTSGTPSETVRIMAHDEITHVLWPNADSQYLLDTFTNPSTRDNFGMRQFVLAYRNRQLYG